MGNCTTFPWSNLSPTLLDGYTHPPSENSNTVSIPAYLSPANSYFLFTNNKKKQLEEIFYFLHHPINQLLISVPKYSAFALVSVVELALALSPNSPHFLL